ncbi:hypothetical protein ACFSBZ_06810 [Amnibacterium flavum]|uniref:Uncharacterized protein n=1 Tax=Amnibacterium flavum TaxID=2173173 RepID=A0A2V1HU76_9MICO|nr:hypothetical protein [Amnibacterium flavum]PVZ93847.1 hypothetical protein DDQ50_08680 [Amnibacterium flavum]
MDIKGIKRTAQLTGVGVDEVLAAAGRLIAAGSGRGRWVRVGGWSLYADGSLGRWIPKTGEVI